MKISDLKILRINLSDKSYSKENLNSSLLKKFFGGRGLGSKLLIDEIDPKVDPFSKENKLIFSCGLLTGTTAPTAGRYMVITKSPLTGTIACSNSGGFFGNTLRKTGNLMVVLEGKSKEPVYVTIFDDKVEIKDASKLWGKDVHQTTDILMDEIGDKKAKVACIGPAGENLSRIASIMNDKNRAAGRSGVGAVMGSKNLKAVVAKGTNIIELANKEKFSEVVKEKIKKCKENGITGEGLPALGTKVLDNIINSTGLYPTNNFQFATFKDVAEVSGEALVEKKYLKKNKACFACPIACGRDVMLPDGERGEGPEYESGWAFGAVCGVNDLFSISKANFMCNKLGLDTISAGVTIATAMELYEKGFIPKKDLNNGPEPKFGNAESIVYYTRAMAYKEGLGKILAEGSYRLAETYGHPEMSMTVKKQELPAYDPRGVQGHGLAYATSNRGGCHVRAYLIAPEILGSPEKLDSQQLEGKPTWVKIFQDLTAVIDSIGFCLFTSFALGLDDYKDLINAALGYDMSSETVLQTGERIWNMEKCFNLNAGIKPKEDSLPARFDEPLPDGPQKGAYSKMKEILPEYYKIRGWDEKGIPKKEKLEELAL